MQRLMGGLRPADLAERRAMRTLRHHVRGWITEWDMRRLYGIDPGLDVSGGPTNYTESPDVKNPPPRDNHSAE